ncbi:MAG: YqaE/Pmp3 family membrane protein [Chloroflexota bacterium]|nr:YqaE/Pmp3 family membrane protein [Chloroflexota bacterium]
MSLPQLVLSYLFPPLGVFFKVGFGLHFWLNIVLTFFGYWPGLLHRIWVLGR